MGIYEKQKSEPEFFFVPSEPNVANFGFYVGKTLTINKSTMNLLMKQRNLHGF